MIGGFSLGGFSLDLARTPADSAEARRLRDEVYRAKLGLDTRQWPQDDARDRAGYLFLLREHGSLVGTGRVMRTNSPLCELRALGQLPAHLHRDTDTCEVGRVATRKRADGIPTSLVMLCLGARWLLRHTDLRRYVAYARVSVLWLYQKVGAADLGTRFQIPDRGDAQYAVILGELADAATAVDRFGAGVAARTQSEAR
ncbi:MAG: hypothetical protein ACRDYX_09975 [Egibacteraceae bacterium]